MSTSTLLQTRNKMKSKKPEFERQNASKYNQFKGIWRRPKGIHSKLRRGFKGHKDVPSIGYSSPSVLKGLTSKGLKPILVSNINDLQKIEKECVAVIASSVGLKKRLEILKLAKEKNIQVSGIKNIDDFVNKAKEKLTSKKKYSETKKESQKKKTEESKNKEVKDDKKDESKK